LPVSLKVLQEVSHGLAFIRPSILIGMEGLTERLSTGNCRQAYFAEACFLAG
jgi:hypothetical protein